METSNSTTIASIEKCKERKIDVNENLELHRECCIYRVPKTLRKIKKEAYTPKVISIGPLHHGKAEFADMEKQKIRYKREFGKRITTDKWQDLINFIERNEQHIRNCYGERSTLKKLEFITMILYDAIFIIELFLRYRFGYNNSDFLLDIARTKCDIRLDLQLLENQLPFDVLKGLYELVFSNIRGDFPSFFLLSCVFLHCEVDEVPLGVEVKHFTDLKRYFMKKTHPKPQSREFVTKLPCAVQLQQSGVRFNSINPAECLLDVRFLKQQQRIPCLKGDVELQIPRILVEDDTESLFRNVMAFEQCHYPYETVVCDYVDLMDMLIETEKDVNLLIEAGIISNNLGDSATVARMFNKLGLQIILSYKSCYCDIASNLRAHYDNRWNHTKATLKMVYFSNLWRGTGTVAAVVLLLLTLIQTIFSII